MKNWLKNTKLGNFISLMSIVILTLIILKLITNSGSILGGIFGGGIVAIYYSFFNSENKKIW